MHNFTLASPPIPNIKFLSFVVSEKCVILKICTFSIKKHDFTRKKQQINLNFELALNNTKNYVDLPKTKSAIALTKIILKICTFSIKNHDFTRKKQQINLNFELVLNNSVIMLPTKNYVDRPKTKSARQANIRPPARLSLKHKPTATKHDKPYYDNSFNSDGQQFHRYQPPLTLSSPTHS